LQFSSLAAGLFGCLCTLGPKNLSTRPGQPFLSTVSGEGDWTGTPRTGHRVMSWSPLAIGTCQQQEQSM